MIDLRTGHEIIEAPIGFYNKTTNEFIVASQHDPPRLSEVDIQDEGLLIFTFNDNREPEIYEIMYVFQPQDLADCISMYSKGVGNESKI